MTHAPSTATADRRNVLRARRRRTGAIATLACAVVVILAGCGSSGTTQSSSTASTSAKAPSGAAATSAPAKVSSIAAMVPKSVAQTGTLVVAAATYPPAVIQPENGASPTGWDIENAREIASVMGLRAVFKIIPFDGVIAGLAAHRYDAADGEIYIVPARTKLVTFVTNHASADALMVAAGSKIKSAGSMTDLCGMTLAAELGSVEAQLVQTVAHACAAAGKQAVTLKTFEQQAEVNLALSEGRVDAAVSSASQVAYVLDKTGSQFRLVNLPWAPKHLTGLALARNASTKQFAKAVQAATDYLIKNGSLKKILDKFNRGLGAIGKAQIIPALGGS